MSAEQLLALKIFSGALSTAGQQRKLQVKANILNYMGSNLFQKSVYNFMTKII